MRGVEAPRVGKKNLLNQASKVGESLGDRRASRRLMREEDPP